MARSLKTCATTSTSQPTSLAFKTYKWVVIKGATQLADLADRQVKAAADAELATKGLTKSESDTADLYIGYQAAVGQEKEYTSYDSGWGYGPGWYGGGWYGGGGGITTGQTTTIYIGQLALDMYASSPHTLVWRGVASKTLDPKANPEKQEKNLKKALAKVLKNYPPPPGRRSRRFVVEHGPVIRRAKRSRFPEGRQYRAVPRTALMALQARPISALSPLGVLCCLRETTETEIQSHSNQPRIATW